MADGGPQLLLLPPRKIEPLCPAFPGPSLSLSCSCRHGPGLFEKTWVVKQKSIVLRMSCPAPCLPLWRKGLSAHILKTISPRPAKARVLKTFFKPLNSFFKGKPAHRGSK